MGPFKRTRTAPSSEAGTDLRVRDAAYRRLGHALATVIVTLDAAPPADVRLRVRADARSITVDPMMVTHEAPGTKAAAHRLWFTCELSMVMFGDGEFALVAAGAEATVPQPTAFVAWSDEDADTDPPVPAEALGESELRAAVAALEERCRAAESANEVLKADARRMGEVVAATLDEVQRERERLLDRIAGTNGGPNLHPDTVGDPEAANSLYGPGHGFLARLAAARGAAGTDAR